MAARRRPRSTGYAILAVVIAVLLWSAVQGQSKVQQGFDIPVEFVDVPDDLVLTDQSSDVVNVRLFGSRAALRGITPSTRFQVDVSGAQPGEADYDVDPLDLASRLELPRGASLVSRSPSSLHVTFEPRATRSVRVRPDLEGEPATGVAVQGVDVEPQRVKITGARSEVVRLSEVVTETVDITGLSEDLERDVRLALGGGHLWMENPRPVRVRVRVAEETPPEAEAPEAQGG